VLSLSDVISSINFTTIIATSVNDDDDIDDHDDTEGDAPAAIRRCALCLVSQMMCAGQFTGGQHCPP